MYCECEVLAEVSVIFADEVWDGDCNGSRW
jgi:hypothetical protein